MFDTVVTTLRNILLFVFERNHAGPMKVKLNVPSYRHDVLKSAFSSFNLGFRSRMSRPKIFSPKFEKRM